MYCNDRRSFRKLKRAATISSNQNENTVLVSEPLHIVDSNPVLALDGSINNNVQCCCTRTQALLHSLSLTCTSALILPSTAGGTRLHMLHSVHAWGSRMYVAQLLHCGPGALAVQWPCWCGSLRPAPIHPHSGFVDPIVSCVTTRRPANKGRLAPSLNIAAN